MKSLIKCILGLFFINAAYAPLDPDSVCKEVAPMLVEWVDQSDGPNKPVIICMTNLCAAEIVNSLNMSKNHATITCSFIFGGAITFIFNMHTEANISAINEVEFRRGKVLLTLPGSTESIELDVLDQQAADYWDLMQDENTPRGNRIYNDNNFLRIIQDSPNLLEFIQQVSKDLECKATLTQSVSLNNTVGWARLTDSIPLNQNPLLTILSRPEFKDDRFDTFIEKYYQLAAQKYADLSFSNDHRNIDIIQAIIFSYLFGDLSTLQKAGLSDTPHHIKTAGLKLLELVKPHITLIPFDQQPSSSSQTPI